jgi:hypothetical protein
MFVEAKTESAMKNAIAAHCRADTLIAAEATGHYYPVCSGVIPERWHRRESV